SSSVLVSAYAPLSTICPLSLHDALPICHIGKRHMRLIDQHPSARLSACIDIKRRETIGGLALQYPYFRDLGDFLASPEAQNTDIDRKSTRLNSSHVKISYAVFCLKKKNA